MAGPGGAHTFGRKKPTVLWPFEGKVVVEWSVVGRVSWVRGGEEV